MIATAVEERHRIQRTGYALSLHPTATPILHLTSPLRSETSPKSRSPSKPHAAPASSTCPGRSAPPSSSAAPAARHRQSP
ncbi:hypothetical protein BT67DRAFT_443036 [Trichocladium antarcticum]|uniref:Uncharacterized protein n=1 Tax=Trichocladium antarcticum TaxID=1450529 RepID=A0AAN6UHG8_9PEZI|nr:hypothetical protein BT67DRAFT_443036 [Trichocladium antarcticum]